MKKIFDVLTSKRFKSFYWRTAMMSLAGFVTVLANSLGDFGFSGQFAIMIGLVLGEISKYLNKSAK